MEIVLGVFIIFGVGIIGFTAERDGRRAVTKDVCKHMFERHIDVDKCIDNPPWKEKK